MTEIDRNLSFEQRCPICGGNNHCAMAASPAAKDCWCRAIEIDPALLEALPEESRGKACLCANCCQPQGGTVER